MAASTQGASRPVASIVALVLGILALIISWVPIVNNFAFVVGAIGVVFAIVGAIGVFRGKRVGKALAFAALMVNIVSIAVVLGTQSMYSAAIDDAVNGPAATGTSQGGEQTTDLAVGTTVELENGLTVTVDSVETGLANYDDSTVIGVQVTYVNNGDESASYNVFDWKGEDANGAQESYTYYSSAENELGSGTLAAGGSVTGNIYFEDGTVKVLYFGTAIADEPAASWTLS